MLAKKFALGFGIAIILPMLVHYGVSTFSPAPQWQDRYKNYSYQKYQNATSEEKIKAAALRRTLTANFCNSSIRISPSLNFSKKTLPRCP